MMTLEQVQNRLRLYERALSSSSCGITIADARQPDMPLIYINDGFERITGYHRDEVLGHNCRFLQGPDQGQTGVQTIREAIRNKQNCTVQLRNYRKDGTFFWNELFMSPVFDSDGTLTHFIGVQTDVTARETAAQMVVEKQQQLQAAYEELRDTQAMLVHSEKMNALGQMVAGVAHEINNPIAFVNSNIHSVGKVFNTLVDTYAQLEDFTRTLGADVDGRLAELRDVAELDYLIEDTHDLLRESLGGLLRVKRIVDGLRTFSRLDEAEFKESNLLENVESTLVVARGILTAAVEVNVDIPPDLSFRCAPGELNQVFLNLITNAAQAMDGRGTLTIRALESADEIIITFADSGPGMTDEIKRHIFEPFFTTKPVGVGTGLGLAIAHRIITRQHGGTITVDSEPGAGAVFTLTLPKRAGK